MTLPSFPDKKPLAVFGASGHAKVVLDIVERQGRYETVSLLDRYKPAGTECGGIQVNGTLEDLRKARSQYPELEVVVAIGDNWARARISAELEAVCPGIRFAIVIHPSAEIGRDVVVGEGTVIMAGAVVNPAARIGAGCILNTRASLDHDSTMAKFTSLGPAATIGGGVQIGEFSSVGIGATVIQELAIGAHTVIGAGAVVVRSIPDFVVAYGTPARIVRKRQPGDRYLGEALSVAR